MRQAAYPLYLNLTYLAGADAATTLEMGRLTVVPALSADRNHTLPVITGFDQRVGVVVPASNASFACIIKTGAGNTCDFGGSSISASTEITRLFLGGEIMVLRSVSMTEWIVEHDGRIAQKVAMRLSTSASGEAADTWTSPTAASGVWTADVNVGSGAGTANDRVKVRRNGFYDLSASAYPPGAPSGYYGVSLWLNGTSTLISAATPQLGFAPSQLDIACFAMISGDTVNYQYLSQMGSIGLLSSAALLSFFSVREKL